MNKTLIIAEAGVNHNGSMKLAKKLIDLASKSGADYVKFQSFKTELVFSKIHQKRLTKERILQTKLMRLKWRKN